MLKPSDLESWLHRELSQGDKLLLVLATFDTPQAIKAIVQRASEAGLRMGSTWNPSTAFGRLNGLAIRTPNGWKITDSGIQHLRNLGVGGISPAAVKVAVDLRSSLSKISDPDTRSFVEEAIKCLEAELYRSAVVMSWLAAIDVLQKHIVNFHLAEFNNEAKRVSSTWKVAKTPDDIGRMSEKDFLDRLAAISVLGKNVKEELKVRLDLRNASGHPNSLKLGANMVVAHLESLLLNVFTRFSG